MSIPSDLDISRATTLAPISEVAAGLGIGEHLLEPYGKHVAKVSLDAIDELADRPAGKYVVVSAITPTPPGEGKTTTTVGLGQGLNHIGKRSVVAVRQPSMGPTFGIKGGAQGGGYSQVVPMESLNLHLTGDMHAVTEAHNMLAAMIDNHIYRGNALGIDPSRITWRRVTDVDDRDLRSVVTGLGPASDGVPRQTGFDITAASEVMAVLALSNSLQDMRERMGRIVVGYTRDGSPVTAEQLRTAGAMTVIMREAIKPNLLQTTENTPVFVHSGPFGNIATGNSSIVADRIAIRGADFVVTEAGFGADMGAERFFNIKCRISGLRPDAAVLVATVRALKAHSGRYRVVAGRPLPEEMLAENPEDVLAGAANLRKQIANIRVHGVSPVVAINAFPTDYPSEHRAIAEVAEEEGARVAVSDHFTRGGKGAAELAEAVAEAAEEPTQFQFLYPSSASLREKIEAVATVIYGAQDVSYQDEAAKALERYEANGFGELPVCMAKTHLSLSSDPKLKGAPTGWTLPVREVRASVGAGFIYPICGDMRTMPGLGSHPAVERIDIDGDGRIVGLDWSLLDQPVRDFLAEVAAPLPQATGGTVSAVTAAAAAGLCAMVAGIHGADDARARAERARAAAGELVDADGAAYAAVMAARRLPADAPERTRALHDALRTASDPPLRLCRVAADVAGLAAGLAGQVRGGLRGDAVTAADLASAAARAAAALVRVNRTAAGDGPDSYAEAANLAAAAATHADAAHERLAT